ncbi:MAG: septal ring lytic transglycosylase RlpA family protein [Actinomycetota bacterium]|nr:septal ring lytic transglycosylase RlpA family protein [Actinomycetota bacterium]
MSPVRLAVTSIAAATSVLLVPVPVSGQTAGSLVAIRKQLADANAQSTRILNQMRALDTRIYRLGGSIKADEREVARLERGVRSMESKISTLEKQMQAIKRSSNARARRIYKIGPGALLETLFSTRTFDDVPRLRMFWEIIAEQDGRTIIESSRLKTQMAEEKVMLSRAASRLEARAKRLGTHQEELKADRRQREAKLQELRVAIEKALAAERAVLAARAAPVRAPRGGCVGGTGTADRKLAALLAWYAPASGSEPFMPPKLSSTGIVTTGVASWYGPGFDGCRSSSGATFRAAQMTAASLSLPLGTLVKVSSGGKAVVVVITDRGPYVGGRAIDLSQAAAQSIGVGGLNQVRMEVLLPSEPAPPFP